MRWKEQTIALLIFIVRLFYLKIHFVKRWSSCGFRNKIKCEISGLRCSHSVFPADLPTRHCLSRTNTALITWNWAIVLYTWECRDRMECSINRMSLLGGHQPTKKAAQFFCPKLFNCPLPCNYRDTERGGEREIYEWMRDEMAGGKDCFDNYVIFKLQCVLSAWSCKCTNGEQVFSAIQCDQNIRNCLDLNPTGKVKSDQAREKA